MVRGALFTVEPDATAPTLVEINLGSPAQDHLSDRVSVSADSRHVGYLLSPAGGTTIFSGFRVSDAGVQVAIDGKPEKTKYGLLSMPVFSDDGRHYACTGGLLAGPGGKIGKMLFVADGRAYDDGVSGFMSESPRFSPDGQRFAYCATGDSTKFVVTNGKKGRLYTEVGDVVFSPDSKHLAYPAQRDGKWCIVNDGTEGPLYEAVGKSMPVFSPDSKHVAYPAQRGNQWVLNLDGRESPPADEVYSPRFNPNGNGFAFCIKQKGQAAVFYNGKPLDKAYDGVSACIFSPDGLHTAHCAQRGGKWLVVIGGVDGKEYKDVEVPRFSRDGNHAAYLATEADGRQRVVIDGREGKPYAAADEPLLSADGKHVAYGANLGDGRGWCVVKDGVEGPAYGDVKNVAMSEDGEHLAHWIVVNGKHQLMVDGHSLATYDGTFDKAQIVFDSKTSLHALGYRNGVIYRAEAQAAGGTPAATSR
jgi:hypothetical protein